MQQGRKKKKGKKKIGLKGGVGLEKKKKEKGKKGIVT